MFMELAGPLSGFLVGAVGVFFMVRSGMMPRKECEARMALTENMDKKIDKIISILLDR